jgi:hypothetical protein
MLFSQRPVPLTGFSLARLDHQTRLQQPTHQVIILFIELSVFSIPRVSEFVTAVYAVILSLAKAAWFLSPVASLNRAQVFLPQKVTKSSTRGYETVR